MEKEAKIINIQKGGAAIDRLRPHEMISLSKCKALLQKDGSVYTDSEVEQVREFLYKLAVLDHEVFLNQQKREREFEAQKEELKQAA